jgi:hypothetical protein
MSGFSDEIAKLRQERLAEQWEYKRQEAVAEAENIRALQGEIHQALQRGDRETAKDADQQLCESEQRYYALAQELNPPGQMTPDQAEILSQHDPADLAPQGRAHWYGRSKFGNTPITGLQGLAHGHEIALAYNYQPGTKEYREIVESAGPESKTSLPRTPDDAVAITNKGAKYRITGRDWNNGYQRALKDGKYR